LEVNDETGWPFASLPQFSILKRPAKISKTNNSGRDLMGRKILVTAMVGLTIFGVANVWAQGISSTESIQIATSDIHQNITSERSKNVEDWSTPLLKGSEFGDTAPLVGEIDDRDPAFTREITRVQWRAGDPIDLYIIKPTGVQNPPLILYLYSFPSENDRFLNAEFCKFLTRNGVAAVGFSTALTGQRYQGRPMKQWFVSELQEALATSAHDVQLILNYLATRGDLNVENVGVFGDGSGASIAILTAAVDQRIKTLDLLNPWGDWPDWIPKSTRIPERERATFLKPDFLAAVAPLDPVKWLPELKTQKIRLQEIASVTVTPNEAKQKIEAAAPANVQLIRYQDTSEFLKATSGGRAFDWIKAQVRDTPVQDYGATGKLPTYGTRQQTR
jgi:hypothetical protein